MSMKVIRRLLKNFFKKFGTDSNVVDVVANLIKQMKSMKRRFLQLQEQDYKML